jgi:hypothetical protein
MCRGKESNKVRPNIATHLHDDPAEVFELVRVRSLRIHAEEAGVVVDGIEGRDLLSETILGYRSGQAAARVMRSAGALHPVTEHRLQTRYRPYGTGLAEHGSVAVLLGEHSTQIAANKWDRHMHGGNCANDVKAAQIRMHRILILMRK